MVEIEVERAGETVASHSPRLRRSGLLLGILISAAFLYFSLHGIDFLESLKTLSAAKWPPILLAVAFGIAANILRTIRWGTLLGFSFAKHFQSLFRSLFIGYLANNLLPARLGEFVRVYILSRKTSVTKSAALATVFVERLTDSLFLLILLESMTFFLPFPEPIRKACQIFTLTFILLAAAISALTFKAHVAYAVVSRMTKVLPYSLGVRVKAVFERFIEGLAILKKPTKVFMVLVMTCLIWVMEGVTVMCLVSSLGMRLSWLSAFAFLIVISLSFIIPSAPGAVGTYEFFAVKTLVSFGIEANLAFGLALLSHAFMLIMSTFLGFLCLWAEGLSLSGLTDKVAA